MTNNLTDTMFSIISYNIDFVMTCIFQMFMCFKLNSLFDSDMKVYYVTHVLNQGTTIKTMCHNYVLVYIV